MNTKIVRRGFFALTALSMGLMLGLGNSTLGQASYPNRDITNVVVFSAGGGTDISNRIVGAEMAKTLPVRINVTNKPGGVAGSLGMNFVLEQPTDGYTIVGLSESVVTAGVLGGWEKKMSIWYPFIIGASPEVLSVSTSAPYKTLAELLKAAKDNPGSIRAGASAVGSIHHINLLAFQNGTGAKFNYIPYPGSAPAQNAALTGEVSVIITSLAEQQQLIKGGRLRPLAMLTEKDFNLPGVGTIPSAIQDFPALEKYLPVNQAIGFAVHKDAPNDVKNVLNVAFKKAMESEAVKKWASDNYYNLSGKSGKAAQAEYARLESLFSWTLFELGAAKIHPGSLLIPRPK
jgi:tripartite-type tricarboxylate transporter receptor subunit TctC